MNKEGMQTYTEVYNNLKAPEQWKTDIKSLMRDELTKNNNHIDNMNSMQRNHLESVENQKVVNIQSKKRLSKGYKMILTAGGIAAAVLLIFTVNIMNGPRFVTPMKDGEIQSEVALKNTTLYFEIQEKEDSAVLAGKQDDSQSSVTFQIDGDKGEVITSDNQADEKGSPSYVKGIPVYLTIIATDEGYQYTAVYEKDGETCEFTRVGITQKEFIRLLYKAL
ncbi:MAG: hypothetical protein Q4D51_11170 [Eubacteriales bacterium]|nr:hypothetical protein [Eubacteriales bacterium]